MVVHYSKPLNRYACKELNKYGTCNHEKCKENPCLHGSNNENKCIMPPSECNYYHTLPYKCGVCGDKCPFYGNYPDKNASFRIGKREACFFNIEDKTCKNNCPYIHSYRSECYEKAPNYNGVYPKVLCKTKYKLNTYTTSLTKNYSHHYEKNDSNIMNLSSDIKSLQEALSNQSEATSTVIRKHNKKVHKNVNKIKTTMYEFIKTITKWYLDHESDFKDYESFIVSVIKNIKLCKKDTLMMDKTIDFYKRKYKLQ